MRISPFVGRDGELDAVVTAVAHVTHAGLTAVVISGEAGIGKSRLLAEAADAIDRRGWRVLPVRADGLERHVPYAALGAAMQELAVDNTFAEGLRREALAALELPVEPGSAGAAFGRACASMSRLLTALAASGPLVVTIDDLHQLDDDSLALLAVVLNRLTAVPIGLIVAMRNHPAESNPAAEELLRRLEDRADVVRIELDMLSPEHLAVVVAGTLGAAPDQALADEVCRRSDGNPYFATEIAQSLLDSHLVVSRRPCAPVRAGRTAASVATVGGAPPRPAVEFAGANRGPCHGGPAEGRAEPHRPDRRGHRSDRRAGRDRV